MKFRVTYVNNKIKTFSSINEIENPLDVKTLNCSNNKLTSLPKEIRQLTNLKELYCYNNWLTSLPQEIGQLTNLEKLYCFSNQLTSLPISLINLRYLTTCVYNDNPIENIPLQVERFLYRINNKQDSFVRVYADGQNTHDSSIVRSVKASLANILKEDVIDYSL